MNLLPVTYSCHLNKYQKNNSCFSKTLSFKNLAPLDKDTVSFSGRAKLISSNMKDAPSEINCRIVSENAEPARYYLESVLDKYIGKYTSDSLESDTSKFPVKQCTTRTKKPASIREKVVSRFSKIYKNEADKFSNQVFDELIQYFKLNPDVQKEKVIAEIKKIIHADSKHTKISPYENSAFFLSVIMEAMQRYNYFDIDNYSPGRIKQAFTEIEESLSSSTPEDTVSFEPTGILGIKHYAKDIVGARIVLRESDPEYTSVVINALKEAVIDGALKITSIENNVPDPDKLPSDKQVSDYLYATDAQLRSLAKASGAELIKNKSKTGYLAVHINVDLSNKIFERNRGVFNGYSGEIQIIGQDVEQLKDVEDLCYKLKDNKNAIHAAYMPFKEHFLKYYNESTKDAFDDYTYYLYLAQRSVPPGTKHEEVFPTIQELGFEGKVPKELDFNLLRRIKAECDTEKKKMEDEQKTSSLSSSHKSYKKRDDIKNIKSFISYVLG